MKIVARAPGKLFLLGEYAVLDGGPAVLASVDRYAEAVVAIDQTRRVRISAPKLDAEISFAASQPPLPHGPLRFAVAAWHEVALAVPSLAELGLQIEILTDLSGSDGTKLGLGSSAAVTVAMTGALCGALGINVEEAESFSMIHAMAHCAHLAAQGGRGSGADIAASTYGGVLLVTPVHGEIPQVRRLKLPAELKLLAGWTGEAAATTDFLERYLAAGNGQRHFRELFVETSAVCVEELLLELASGSLTLRPIDEQGDALIALGADLGIPLMTPGLVRLMQIARRAGAAAKISGAGGGDCGIAMTTDAAVAEHVCGEWQAAGIVPLAVQVAEQGVHVEAH